MPKKDDVSIVRARDFQQVDEDLTAAMEGLDQANLKIEELLNSSDVDLESTTADEETDEGETGETPDAPPAKDEDTSS